MRVEATMEQWTKLYELSVKIKELRPWKVLLDIDVLVIYLENREEPMFVSVMGSAGDCIGLVVYPGMEGLHDFDMIATCEQTGLSPQYVMYEQSSLACYFGNRDEVPRVQKKIMREAGQQFRGNGNWPFFMSYERRYTPDTPDQEEVALLIETYEQVIILVEQVRDGSIQVGQQEGKFVTRRAGETTLEPLPYNQSREYPFITLDDEELVNDMSKKPETNQSLSIDFVYLGVEVADEKYDRPANPLCFVVMDSEHHTVVATELLEPDVNELDITLQFFVEYVMNYGRMKRIEARNTWVFAALFNVCQACNVELGVGDVSMIDDMITNFRKN